MNDYFCYKQQFILNEKWRNVNKGVFKLAIEKKIPEWVKYVLVHIYPDIKKIMLAFWMLVSVYIIFNTWVTRVFQFTNDISNYNYFLYIYFALGCFIFVLELLNLIKRIFRATRRSITIVRQIENLGQQQRNLLYTMYISGDFSIEMQMMSALPQSLVNMGLVWRPEQITSSFGGLTYYLTPETIKAIKKYNLFKEE